MLVFYSSIWVKSNDTFSEWHHHQTVANSQKEFRMPESLGILPEQFFWQGSKVLRSQTADEEWSAENVINILVIITKGAVVFQPHQLSVIVANNRHRVREGVHGLNCTSHELLHGFQGAIQIHPFRRLAW